MRALGSTAIGISAVTALVAGALLSHRSGGSPSPRDPAPLESIYENDRGAELERQRLTVMHRVAAKQKLCRAVVRRELTLLEAARQMRDVVDADPVSCALLRDLFAGCSDEEIFCRHLMELVEIHALEQPAAAADLARLEAKLDDLRCRDALHFPSP
jgi:hypothetical protein